MFWGQPLGDNCAIWTLSLDTLTRRDNIISIVVQIGAVFARQLSIVRENKLNVCRLFPISLNFNLVSWWKTNESTDIVDVFLYLEGVDEQDPSNTKRTDSLEPQKDLLYKTWKVRPMACFLQILRVGGGKRIMTSIEQEFVFKISSSKTCYYFLL